MICRKRGRNARSPFFKAAVSLLKAHYFNFFVSFISFCFHSSTNVFSVASNLEAKTFQSIANSSKLYPHYMQYKWCIKIPNYCCSPLELPRSGWYFSRVTVDISQSDKWTAGNKWHTRRCLCKNFNNQFKDCGEIIDLLNLSLISPRGLIYSALFRYI